MCAHMIVYGLVCLAFCFGVGWFGLVWCVCVCVRGVCCVFVDVLALACLPAPLLACMLVCLFVCLVFDLQCVACVCVDCVVVCFSICVCVFVCSFVFMFVFGGFVFCG